MKFGLDAILGLLPGFGDTAASFVSLYILHAANRRGVSRVTMTRMALNLAIDYLVGAIPIAGDVFDVYWKANQKNVELLQRHMIASPGTERRLQANDWMFLAGLAAVLIAVLVGSMTLAYVTIAWLGSILFSSTR